MDKIKLEILGLSSSHSQAGSFALVLGEVNGTRRLPIIIGTFEAQAIAIEIEKISPNRPMTHDLFKSFSHHFKIKVKEIIISDLKEGVFFAKIVCEHLGQTVEIDSRPSDAIAIGIRFKADIYTKESVLEDAGITLSDEFEDELETAQKPESKPQKPGKKKEIKDFSTEKLNKMLEDALAKEDYEGAAKIRDELNKRN
ncbi:bifunctional nuclease family protein [Reichenbachiella sp. MALMAid0571]|uniref:bifunctional nuclease family protein n=1 Tax=Reichenbachiella sp. MALMAid0571 TaxID=3143939 RepID=UPI0032DFD98A